MQESGEMYLETILVLNRTKNRVRAIDVVEHMGFSKPAVSRALSRLKNEDCILVDSESGHISLTDKGTDIAEKIYERHRVLSDVLVSIGVDEQTAITDACKIEHDISDKTFDAIKQYAEKQKKRP